MCACVVRRGIEHPQSPRVGVEVSLSQDIGPLIAPKEHVGALYWFRLPSVGECECECNAYFEGSRFTFWFDCGVEDQKVEDPNILIGRRC